MFEYWRAWGLSRSSWLPQHSVFHLLKESTQTIRGMNSPLWDQVINNRNTKMVVSAIMLTYVLFLTFSSAIMYIIYYPWFSIRASTYRRANESCLTSKQCYTQKLKLAKETPNDGSSARTVQQYTWIIIMIVAVNKILIIATVVSLSVREEQSVHVWVVKWFWSLLTCLRASVRQVQSDNTNGE